MQKSKFRGAVVGTSIGLIAFGSVASAAFLASGELNAPVTTGTVQTMEVTVEVPTELFPGYLEDATITLTNPNPVPTRVTDVTFKEWQSSTPELTPYLISAPSLALNGLNAAGAPAPLLLQPGQTKSVTLENVVGLVPTIPNQSTVRSGSKPFQGIDAVAVYSVTYVAANGTEVPGGAALPKK
jgi:hypothetical protein